MLRSRPTRTQITSMAKMLAFEVSRPGGPLEWSNVRFPSRARGWFASRSTRAASATATGQSSRAPSQARGSPAFPGGHEVVGVIDACGPGVTRWKAGDRVGGGYNGGYDGECEACQRGDFFACVSGQVTGATSDGGYAQYMLARTSAVAPLPAALTAVDAAPLMRRPDDVQRPAQMRRTGGRPRGRPRIACSG